MIGRTIDRYRITARLGQGGMGSVWKAQDTLLGRTVALKILSEELTASEEARRRFLREARAAARLEHPGIATVFDTGEERGSVYISFLFVDGETVADRIARGPLPLKEAFRIAASTAAALGHAHGQGVLHRDVTSRNIMISKAGKVVVVDFGLALPDGHASVTRTGQIAGTPAYMAPEVLRGGDADARSDLYGLGVVLYEMVTSRLPFKGDRPEALMYAALHEAPAAPSAIRPGLPPPVDRLILKALARAPGERHQHAGQLLHDLRRLHDEGVLPGPPLPASEAEEVAPPSISGIATAPAPPGPVSREVTAVPPPEAEEGPPGEMRPAMEAGSSGQAGEEVPSGPGSRTAAREGRRSFPAGWWRATGLSRRAGLGLTTGAVAMLILVGALTSGALDQLRVRSAGIEYASVAVLPFRNLSPDAGQSDIYIEGLGETLSSKLTGVAGIHVSPWVTSRRYSLDADASVQELAGELNVEAIIDGSFSVRGGRLSVSAVLIDAGSGFNVWAEEFEAPAGDFLAVHSNVSLAIARRLKGHLTGEEADKLARPVSVSDEAFSLYLKGNDAMRAGSEEDLARALEYYRKALDIDPGLEEAHVGAGAVHTARYFNGWEGGERNLEIAEAEFRRALELDPGHTGAMGGLIRVQWSHLHSRKVLEIGARAAASGRDDAESLLVRAEAYIFGGLVEKGIPLLQRVIEIDPANRHAHWTRVYALHWNRRFEESIAAAEAFFERFGSNPEVHLWACACYARLDELEAALLHCELSSRLFPEGSRPIKWVGLGRVLQDLGHDEEAEVKFDRGIRLLRSKLRAYPDNARMKGALIRMLGLAGRLEELDLEASRLLAEEELTARAQVVIARSYLETGRPGQALTLLRSAHQAGVIITPVDNSLWIDPSVLESEPYREVMAFIEERTAELAAQY